jgi:tRNA-dihydrouridine synthase B
MRDESRVGRRRDAVVAAAGIPVTLKTRTGWDPDSHNALRIAYIAEQSGIRALAIHGRTRACGFSGEAEYDTIREVKAAAGIPVIANGDIDSPAKARLVLDVTGADALMIGRAAQGRPWIFAEINHYLATGRELAPPSPAWIRDLLLEHLDNLYSLYGSEHGVRIARKHIAWYSRSQAGGNEFRRRINRAQTTQEQNRLISDYFDSLSPWKEWAA